MLPIVINDVPAYCIQHAAQTYQVPALLIVSVLKTENGRNGMANINTNGTYDYGPMQINSRWLTKIKSYGYTQEDIQFDPCKNVNVGTWILKTSLNAESSLSQGIGDYHSHTLSLNQQYTEKVYSRLSRIEAAL